MTGPILKPIGRPPHVDSGAASAPAALPFALMPRLPAPTFGRPRISV